MAARTVHQQIHTTLSNDRILAALGFDHRSIGEEPPQRPALVLHWDEQWYGTRAGYLGGLTVEPVGLDELSSSALFDRVDVILSAVRPGHGPVRRITRDLSRPGRFTVLVA